MNSQLWALVEHFCDEGVQAWLRTSVASLACVTDLDDDLAILLATAHRRVGNDRLPDAMPALHVDENIDISVSGWELAELVRNLLLSEVVAGCPEREVEIVKTAFRFGDEAERTSIMRGLAMFPQAANLKPIALEVGRVNSMRLFQALALDNVYPSLYYNEHEFNQLVLKSLFNMLPIDRVVGLSARANVELSRMCADYVQERLDAGRTVPVKIWLALAPCVDEQGKQHMREFVHSDNPEHRRYCGCAMATYLKEIPEFRDILQSRLAVETDSDIVAAMRTALT